MNVLQIARAFAYEANLPAPTTVSGSLTDPADLQIINLIYSVSRSLRQERCWPQQKNTHTITLEDGRTAYPLPADFYGALLGTQWDVDQARRMDGPMGDSQFTERLYGEIRLNSQKAFRIFGPDFNPNTAGGQFKIDPAPAGGEEIYFEYVSKNLFLPPNWLPLAVIPADSYRNANGKIFYTSAGGTTSSTPPTTTGTEGTVAWVDYSANNAYEFNITDSDFSIFDDDLLIAGLLARWYQMKGLGYEALAAEFSGKVDMARNRWNGSYLGSFNRYLRNWRRFRPSTPGGWSF